MQYKPKALDVDKMEGMFDMLDKVQQERRNIEIAKVEAYNSGYRDAVDSCRSALTCSNYEIQLRLLPAEVVREVFYELCKELDIPGSDIYDAGLSIDETAAMLAVRIRESLAEVSEC